MGILARPRPSLWSDTPALPDPRRGGATTWTVAAPFIVDKGGRWLDDLVADDRIRFAKIPRRREDTGWRSGRAWRGGDWMRHVDQAVRAYARRPDGIVTCFPQLAMCVALLKRLGPWKPRLIAYNYNLGGLPGGLRRRLARFAAPAVDLFVVHAPSEVGPYAAWLGVPETRVRFVPLQRGAPGLERAEDAGAPFLLAMGSAHRDYATLLAALDLRPLPAVIVTRPDIAATLPRRPHVTVRSNLSAEECMALLARARLSVTPVANQTTASGQITFVNAMRLGVPVIATRCPGTEGYVEDGRTGLLVPPGDAAALAGAIGRLWDDARARETLSGAARAEAEASFSDEAAAAWLGAMIGELRGRPPLASQHRTSHNSA
jgi:hypothetical protein